MEENRNQAGKETPKETGEVWIPCHKVIGIVRDVRLDCFVILTDERAYQIDSVEKVKDQIKGIEGYRFRPLSKPRYIVPGGTSVAEQEG